MLPHAPSVQMQAIPEDAIPDDTVDEDTEDPDKRLSSESRLPPTVTPQLPVGALTPSTPSTHTHTLSLSGRMKRSISFLFALRSLHNGT